MKYETKKWGIGASCIFSACMSSKISQLKFGTHELKECNGAVLNRLKMIRGLGPPISPSGHQGGPNFPIARVSNLPTMSPKGPKCSIAPSRAQFPVFSTRSFSLPTQFPHCFIKGFQFPHCVIKGPKNFHCAIKGLPISSSCHQNDELLISHNVIKRFPFIIASSMGPHCDLEFLITLSRDSNLSLRHQRAPISPIASSKGPKFPKYTIYITYEI